MRIPKEAQVLYNRAEEYIDKREYKKAIDCLIRSLEIEPYYAEAISRLGYVHYKLEYKKMSREEVFNLCKKALGLAPKSPIALNYMGIIYSEKKEYDKAIEFHEKALEIDPKYIRAWNNMGLTYNDKNEYDRAINCYKKAIEIDPNNADAWDNMGSVYRHKNEDDRAIECYKKAIEIDPNNANAWYNMGLVYRDNKKNYGKADECLKKSLDLKPEYKNLIRKTIFELGMKYNRLEIAEIAEKCGMLKSYVPIVAQDMIKKKEIHADYFKSTKSLVFDQRPNIDEIDALMKKYDEWVEEGRDKKD